MSAETCPMFWDASELVCSYSSKHLKETWKYFLPEWKKNCRIPIKNCEKNDNVDDFKWIVISATPFEINPDIKEFDKIWLENEQKFGIDQYTQKLIFNEGYLLAFYEKRCVILAKTGHGCFNGLQMLLQFVNYISIEQIPNQQSSFMIFDFPDLQYRGFHLDLKKLTPTFTYVKEMIPFLARYRINYLLLEYEDKFPYTGSLASIPHEYAWSVNDLEEIKNLCAAHFIEITPLIQVFGHVETFVLKADFRNLQEQPTGSPVEFSPMESWSLCPLHEDTEKFVSEMVRQQVEAHPNSEFIHIGADEVYQLGTCPKCKAFVESHSKSELYIKHINMVAKYVLDAGKRPIMWHDYLLKYPEAIAQLDKRIVIMYWIYDKNAERVNPQVPPPNPSQVLPYFEYFANLGHNVIGAPSSSADFDGFIPNYATRLENILRHCNRAKDANALGVLVTSWVVCLNPLETQLPLIAISGAEMWNPGGIITPTIELWKRWETGLQREMWYINETKHIEWFENFAYATEWGRKRWPTRDAIARFPQAHQNLLQIRSYALTRVQLIDSLLLGLDWRQMHGLIVHLFVDKYLPFVEAEDKACLPSVDEMQDHASILSQIAEKESKFFQTAIKYYTETTHQIYPREFDLILGMPRYNVLTELKGLGRDLQDASEALDRFILGFLRLDLPI
jgi:hypothetical protein